MLDSTSFLIKDIACIGWLWISMSSFLESSLTLDPTYRGLNPAVVVKPTERPAGAELCVVRHLVLVPGVPLLALHRRHRRRGRLVLKPGARSRQGPRTRLGTLGTLGSRVEPRDAQRAGAPPGLSVVSGSNLRVVIKSIMGLSQI